MGTLHSKKFWSREPFGRMPIDCREEDAPEPTNAYNQSKRGDERHTLA